MPSLIGNYVAGNYRQQIVPFSRFGTRKVAWFKVGYADTKSYDPETDTYNLDMENMNNIISAIQTQAEIVMIGAPEVRDNFGKFMVAVFEDTMNNGVDTDVSGGFDGASLTAEGAVGYNGNSETIQQVLRNATGDNDMTFERFYLRGAPQSGTNDNYGWSDSADYREYDTKAQFLGGYTQNV